MKRRDFMHLLSSTGLGVIAPLTSKKSYALDPDHMVITVAASGGWDATMLCDPKGNMESPEHGGKINLFSNEDIKTAGGDNSGSPIRYAPIDTNFTQDTASFDTFFANHRNKMVVINGIEVLGGHPKGMQAATSGLTEYPSISALTALTHGPSMSNGFISFGGGPIGDSTQGIMAVTRLSSLDAINLVTSTNTTQSDDVANLIKDARLRAINKHQSEHVLPSRLRGLGQIYASLSDPAANVANLLNYAPSSISGGIKGQAEIVSAALASGMSLGGNIYYPKSFDTHTSNDNYQWLYLQTLIDAVNTLWDSAETYGYADKLTVVMVSEGGRGPFYNQELGKDDISTTSVIVMSKRIAGDRVVQATDPWYNRLKVDPSKLELDEGGREITSLDLQLELRRLLQIDDALTSRYSLVDNGFNLLGLG